LKESKLNDKWWNKAIETAAYLRNQNIASALDNKITPYEALLKKQPDLSNWRVFGCLTYIYNILVKYQMESSKLTMTPAMVEEKHDRDTKLALVEISIWVL
jgi:hypothetical protein